MIAFAISSNLTCFIFHLLWYTLLRVATYVFKTTAKEVAGIEEAVPEEKLRQYLIRRNQPLE